MHAPDDPRELVRSVAERHGCSTGEAVVRLLRGATGGPATPADDVFRELDDRIAREEIAPRLTDDLVREHAEQPIGDHGDDLARVLRYFRRRPVADKLVVVEIRRNERWCLARLSGERGEPPTMTGECFDDPAAAEHAVFVKRLEAFHERYGDGEGRS